MGTILDARFAVSEKLSALHHVDTDISAGVTFDSEVATKAAVSVPTGFNGKFITTNALGPDACLPAIIADRLHARPTPFWGIDRTPQEITYQPIVTVGECVGFDRNRVADDALCCETALIDSRRDVVDHDTRQFGQGGPLGSAALRFKRRARANIDEPNFSRCEDAPPIAIRRQRGVGNCCYSRTERQRIKCDWQRLFVLEISIDQCRDTTTGLANIGSIGAQ